MAKLVSNNYRFQVIDSMQTTLQTYIKEYKDSINKEITTHIITELNSWVDVNKKEADGKNSCLITINKGGVIMRLSDLLRKLLLSSIMKELGFYTSDFQIKDTGIHFEIYISIPPTEL